LVVRRLRDARVVEIVSNPLLRIDTKSEFLEPENLQPVFSALEAIKLGAEMQRDEEHSAWRVAYHDQTNAERHIDIELAAQPEYRRLRALARQTAKLNQPPFVVLKESSREKLENWRDLLAHVKTEGTRDVNVQRYKGLGEMNAEQLWETTMNPERRTLLKIDLRDLVESDEIFSTLMGEDVESRRKFIEENALDVRNLDV
jgi:DNA gyrase subunit B